MVTPIYDTTNLTKNNTNLMDLVRTANTWSEGTLSLGIIISVFIGTYILSYREHPETRFFLASIVTFGLASILRIMSLTNNLTMYVLFAILGLSTVIYFIKTEEGE